MRMVHTSSGGRKQFMGVFLRTRAGVTLIEFLLYIALTSFILVFISVSLSATLQSRVKNETISNVDQEGGQTMAFVMQSIRSALAVNTPATSTSASLLSLHMADSAADPRIFDVASGTMRVIEGAGSPVALTSGRVTISGLTFSNVSRPGTRGVIRVQFTVAHVNPAGKSEYEYAKEFISSASLRP